MQHHKNLDGSFIGIELKLKENMRSIQLMKDFDRHTTNPPISPTVLNQKAFSSLWHLLECGA